MIQVCPNSLILKVQKQYTKAKICTNSQDFKPNPEPKGRWEYVCGMQWNPEIYIESYAYVWFGREAIRLTRKELGV